MDLDIRYIAGLFDGEGWITIAKLDLGGYRKYSKDYMRYQLHIGIGMTYRPVITQLHSQLGGGEFVINRSAQAKMPKARTNYLWKLSSNPAAAFLNQVLPYLVVKKEEAEIAIEFQLHVRKHVGDMCHRPEMRKAIYAEREKYYKKVKSLKKRCFDTPVASDPIPTAA